MIIKNVLGLFSLAQFQKLEYTAFRVPDVFLDMLVSDKEFSLTEATGSVLVKDDILYLVRPYVDNIDELSEEVKSMYIELERRYKEFLNELRKRNGVFEIYKPFLFYDELLYLPDFFSKLYFFARYYSGDVIKGKMVLVDESLIPLIQKVRLSYGISEDRIKIPYYISFSLPIAWDNIFSLKSVLIAPFTDFGEEVYYVLVDNGELCQEFIFSDRLVLQGDCGHVFSMWERRDMLLKFHDYVNGYYKPCGECMNGLITIVAVCLKTIKLYENQRMNKHILIKETHEFDMLTHKRKGKWTTTKHSKFYYERLSISEAFVLRYKRRYKLDEVNKTGELDKTNKFVDTTFVNKYIRVLDPARGPWKQFKIVEVQPHTRHVWRSMRSISILKK